MKSIVVLCSFFALFCEETDAMFYQRNDSQETLISERNRLIEQIEVADDSPNLREPSLFSSDVNEVQEAIERGQDVNMDNRRCGTTPLIEAIENGNAEVVTCLLNNGADPNKKSVAGELPLDVAIRERNLEAVVSLIGNGANPDLEGRRCTPKEKASRLLENATDDHEKAVLEEIIGYLSR